MKSIAEIHASATDVELEDALHEVERELEIRIGTERKPGGAFTRWANAAPADFTKHRNYETQCKRLYAIQLVLATMEKQEFKRRLAAQFAQPALFD